VKQNTASYRRPYDWSLNILTVSTMNTSPGQLEVELKFRVDDGERLQQSLQSLDVQWGEIETQADRYFNHPSRDFATTDEAVRIRSVGPVNCVTYKGPKVDRVTKTRREIEVPLAAGRQAAVDFGELLQALSFRPVATVEKTRRPGILRWEERDVHMAWDNVTGLGEFVEMEILSPQSELDAVRAALLRLADKLELCDSERRGYLDLLLTGK
jgi:adenylate cyclase class 2